MLETVVTTALIGIASGAVYALVAMGMSLGFRSSGLINVAQGDLAVLCAYLGAHVFIDRGVPYGAAIPIVAVIGAVAMLVFDLSILRRLFGANPVYLIIITLGISAVIEAVVTHVWGGNPLVYPAALGSGVLRLGGVRVFERDLIALVVAVALAVALGAVLKFTRLGRDIRAGANDPVAAVLSGVNVSRTRTVTLMLSGALSGLGGMLLAPLTFLYPTTGLDLTLSAFVGAVVGGFGSMPGAVVGSLLFGFVNAVVGNFVPSVFSSVIAYGLLVGVVAVRPGGLFGEEGLIVREV